ncbi:MAG: hypothetical protein ACRC92_26220 [Peptostreptococcaceae bacterium]
MKRFIKFGYEDVNHGVMTFDLSNMTEEQIQEIFVLKDITRSRLWDDLYNGRDDIPYTTEYAYTEESKRYDHRLIECSPDLQEHIDALTVRNTFYQDYKDKVDERNIEVRKDLSKLGHLITTLDVVTEEMEETFHELNDKIITKNYLPILHLMNPIETGRKYHDDMYYAVSGKDLNMMGGIVYPSIKDENNFIFAHIDSESIKNKLESIPTFNSRTEDSKYRYIRELTEDEHSNCNIMDEITALCCERVYDSVLSDLNPFQE